MRPETRSTLVASRVGIAPWSTWPFSHAIGPWPGARRLEADQRRQRESRANITSRQEVGGSSIEASKIAGHAHTKITEEYTIVQMKRQEELKAHCRKLIETIGAEGGYIMDATILIS